MSNVGKEIITVHAYDWKLEEKFGDDDKDVVHAWCMDRDSVSCLERIMNFPAFCYIELPQYIHNRYFRWSTALANQFLDYISRFLKDDAPYRGIDLPTQ